jgi:outer membrane protein
MADQGAVARTAQRRLAGLGRARLRGIEGDLLLELIAAYCDVRRDTRVLAIRAKTVRVLEATLDEIVARREAGELTRTDIAQAQSQLLAARAQLNTAEAQLEASRAAFTAIVGREPGILAPEPGLPGLPGSAQEAFAIAELGNPELAQAMASERAARAGIAVAEAEGRPALSLRANAGTSGPALPLYASEHDVTFAGRVTLSVPLFAGGRVRSQVSQARNRQSAEALRIEATRRALVQAVVGAWNQWVTAERNVEAQEQQRQAARIFYDGTFEEYREGLRSTFDVLYAQNSLRETEIALLSSERDRYVAQAVLLRRLGQLEAGKLLRDAPAYDPDSYRDRVRRRGAVPWGGAIRALDRVGAPGGKPRAIEWPETSGEVPQPPPALPTSAPGALLRGKPGSNTEYRPIPPGTSE